MRPPIGHRRQTLTLDALAAALLVLAYGASRRARRPTAAYRGTP